MNSNLTKSLALCTAMLISPFTSASLITYNAYTLDTGTNIITKDGTEWLQWSITKGMSINSALTIYASDGWSLASNLDVNTLYTDFGFNSTLLDDVGTIQLGDYNSSDTASYDKLIELYGFTDTKVGAPYGTGNDALIRTGATYGSDNDSDGFYKRAFVQSDFTSNGILQQYEALLLSDLSLIDDNSNQEEYGIALVRHNSIEVPEPSTSVIFYLSLILILSRRFNKQF